MTDPTPAEALKAAMREKFDEALKTAYRRSGGLARLIRQTNGAAIIRRIACLEADVILASAIAALPFPATDAGEVRTYREGIEAAAKVVESNLNIAHDGSDVTGRERHNWKMRYLAAAIRGLAR